LLQQRLLEVSFYSETSQNSLDEQAWSLKIAVEAAEGVILCVLAERRQKGGGPRIINNRSHSLDSQPFLRCRFYSVADKANYANIF